MPYHEQNEYLFVYGSLQRKANHPAHNVLREHAQFVCNAEFEGALFMVAEYPGVISSSNAELPVKGELFLLKTPHNVFQKLDQYEGYDPTHPEQSLYLREQCTVKCLSDEQHDKIIQAWIYLFNQPTDNLKRIYSGDYLSYIGSD